VGTPICRSESVGAIMQPGDKVDSKNLCGSLRARESNRTLRAQMLAKCIVQAAVAVLRFETACPEENYIVPMILLISD